MVDSKKWHSLVKDYVEIREQREELTRLMSEIKKDMVECVGGASFKDEWYTFEPRQYKGTVDIYKLQKSLNISDKDLDRCRKERRECWYLIPRKNKKKSV